MAKQQCSQGQPVNPKMPKSGPGSKPVGRPNKGK